MTKRVLTHDDITDACELSEITPYPNITSTDGTVEVTTSFGIDGTKTSNLSVDICDNPETTDPDVADFVILCRNGAVTKLPIQTLTPKLVQISDNIVDDAYTDLPIDGTSTDSTIISPITNPSLVPITLQFSVTFHGQLDVTGDSRARATAQVLVDGTVVTTLHTNAVGPDFSSGVNGGIGTMDSYNSRTFNIDIAAGQTLNITTRVTPRYDFQGAGADPANDLVKAPFFAYSWNGIGLETWES